MTVPRDPRIDPSPGDVLLGGRSLRAVKEYSPSDRWPIGFMYWRSALLPRMSGGNGAYTTLKKWRKWAATAEVLHAAE